MTTTPRAYRIIDTRENIPGPHGRPYMNDPARPFAVLAHAGTIREICVSRCPSMTAAAWTMRNLTNASARKTP